MSNSVGNGLVELVDERKAEKGFFCMDLMMFLAGEDWETFDLAFHEAKQGRCPFQSECSRYKRTVSKYGQQLSLFD